MRHGDGLVEVKPGVQGFDLRVVPPGDIPVEDLGQNARVEVDLAVRSGHGVEERDAADDEGDLNEGRRGRQRVVVGGAEGNVPSAEVVQGRIVVISGARELGLAGSGA